MLHLCIRGVENRSTNVYDDLPGNLLRGLMQERQAFGSDTQLTWCLDIRLHYRGRDPHELTTHQKLSRSIASGVKASVICLHVRLSDSDQAESDPK